MVQGVLLIMKKTKILKQTMLYAFIVGLVTHGYFITNFAYSYDSMQMLYISRAGDHFQIAAGRPFNTLYNWITSTIFATPFLQGLSVILWLGLAAYFVILVFDFTDTVRILIVTAMFETNLAVLSLLATFAPDAAPDFFGVFCASVAVWLWNKYINESKKRYLILSALLLSSALLVYQCNAAVFTVIVVIKLIKDIVKADRPFAKKTIMNGLSAVVIVLISGAVYLLVVKVFMILNDVELLTDSYMSLENAWKNNEGIIERVTAVYIQVKGVLWNNAVATSYQWAIKLINILTIFIFVGMATYAFLAKKRLLTVDYSFTLFLLFAMPLAMNYVRLFNPTTHTCHYFGVWLLYLLPIVLSEEVFDRNTKTDLTMRIIPLVLAALVMLNNVQVSNAAYLKKHMEYERALSVMTDVFARVGMINGYKEGETKVYFEGAPGDALMPTYITSSLSFLAGMGSDPVISNNNLYRAYMEFVLGRDGVRFIERSELTDTEKKLIHNMPIYPDNRSIDRVGDVIVVRFK